MRPLGGRIWHRLNGESCRKRTGQKWRGEYDAFLPRRTKRAAAALDRWPIVTPFQNESERL
jgi:hypothetical protein